MSSLDLHTPKLLTLFRAKGGALGERMETEMELLKDEQCSVDLTREVVIRCIIEFLGEHAGDLIKEFSDNEEQRGIEQIVMAIIVTRTGATSGSSKDTGIVIEGVKVLTGLEGVSRACCLLLGLTYALNLHYPRHLKYTFEVFQKILLQPQSCQAESSHSGLNCCLKNLLVPCCQTKTIFFFGVIILNILCLEKKHQKVVCKLELFSSCVNCRTETVTVLFSVHLLELLW